MHEARYEGKHFASSVHMQDAGASLWEARALSLIKWAAMLFLIVDHVSLALLDNLYIGRLLGRIAFPLFAYMIAMGARYSSRPERYLRRIFIFALISEIPFDLMVSNIPFDLTYSNVLFTFSLALSPLVLHQRLKLKAAVSILISLCAIVLAELAHVDYGGLGVATVLLFYFGCFGFSHEDASLDPSLLRVRLGQLLGLVPLVLIWPCWQGVLLYMQSGQFQLANTIESYAVLSLLFILFSRAKRAQFSLQSKRRAKLWYLVYPGHIIIAVILVYALGIYNLPEQFIRIFN